LFWLKPVLLNMWLHCGWLSFLIPGTFAWEGFVGPVSLHVDDVSFDYEVAVNGVRWLTNGQVTFQCGGKPYGSVDTSENTTLTGQAITDVSGNDSTLGPWRGVERSWRAGVCGGLTTTIRQYSTGFEFLTRVDTSESSVSGTNTCDVTNTACADVSTSFPNFALPNATTNIGFVTWNGNTLFNIIQQAAPPADWSKLSGGVLSSGPLVLYTSTGTDSFAVVLGATMNFKVGMLTRIGQSPSARLAAGVQGLIQQMPANYTLRFALLGRPEGITAAMFTYGAFVQKVFNTARTKLSLAADVLSRQLHYVTDGGSLLNYCDYWPECLNSTEGCKPEAEVLKAAGEYHQSIGLSVGAYHVDPFWYSHSADGGCDDFFARNWSGSPFHFPQGIKGVGLPMMLFLQAFSQKISPVSSQNIYLKDFKFEGQSVSGADSARFFQQIFGKMHATGNFKALTLDGLPDIWQSAPARLTSVDEQQMYDKGLADALLEFGIPIRVDQEFPNDVLASVQYGARTVGRCTSDSDPYAGSEAARFLQLGANSLLFRAMGVRPMVDVLWTNPEQSDPRWPKPSVCRPNIVHDIITAVLSTGPLGFGDLVGKTNASLLFKATRADGVILKPASAALRIDRFYDPIQGGSEIWAAPTFPSRNADSKEDQLANSMAPLEDEHCEQLYGWMILATNVDKNASGSAPVAVTELWPRPAAGTEFFVAQLEQFSSSGMLKPLCINGSAVDSCLLRWNDSSPLPVTTGDTSKETGCVRHNFTLFAASPVLSSGWTLLGDLSKFVPVSPQRFVMAESQETGLRFDVIGHPGEVVPVSMVTETGIVLVWDIHVTSTGKTSVACSEGRCVVSDGIGARGQHSQSTALGITTEIVV
ncbi:unnamed protein product, partial [Polarella glacialis]